MRLLSTAIAAGLVATMTSAQSMQTGAAPAQKAIAPAAAGLKIPPMPPITTVPRLKSKQQRAVAIQTLLSLPTPPTLGEATSLTPAAPAVPGKAELDLGDASRVFGGNLWVSSIPASGAAILTDRSKMFLTIAAGPGMRYALDCRIDPAARAVDYGGLSSSPVGRAPVSTDGHFLIALEKTSGATKLIVAMAPLGSGQYLFYGCEVSPF